MEKTQRDKLLKGNTWIDSNEEYGLTLTDDIDSLLSCAILKAAKGWNIESLYLFKANKTKDKDYYAETDMTLFHDQIGVDLSMTDDKCFDNHLTSFNSNDNVNMNPQSINLNRVNGIHRLRYSEKYNLSTALLLWSLYDLPKKDLSDELMMLLIAIDGSHAGFYTEKKYVPIHEHWMRDVLQLDEFLECEKRHKKEDFEAIREKYNLNGKIKAHDGYLHTKIDLDGINDLLGWDAPVYMELPKEKFELKKTYVDKHKWINRYEYPSSITRFCKDRNRVFSYALTKSCHVVWSEEITEQNEKNKPKERNL